MGELLRSIFSPPLSDYSVNWGLELSGIGWGNKWQFSQLSSDLHHWHSVSLNVTILALLIRNSVEVEKLQSFGIFSLVSFKKIYWHTSVSVVLCKVWSHWPTVNIYLAIFRSKEYVQFCFRWFALVLKLNNLSNISQWQFITWKLK